MKKLSDKDKYICICMCHTKGGEVKHIMACCALTYKKYINPDGTIDHKMYEAYKNESK